MATNPDLEQSFECAGDSKTSPPHLIEMAAIPGEQSQKSGRSRQSHSLSLHSRTLLLYGFADVCSIFIAFASVAFLRGPASGDWLLLVSLLIPLYLILAINGGVYDLPLLRDPYRAAFRGGRSFIITVGILLVASYYLKAGESLPRLTTASGALCATLLLGGLRFTIARNLERILGGNPYSVALIWEKGQPIPDDGFSIIIPAESFVSSKQHDPMMYDRLAQTLKGISNVVVACDPARRDIWAHMLKGASIQSEIITTELQELAPLGINHYGDNISLVVSRGPLDFADQALKRTFDLIVAGTAILVLSPLFVVVAVCIKLETPGPVFFRQTRIGLGNEIFRIFKFRSMRVAQEDALGSRSASREDERITRVGRFIRSTSIDELPQLVNVLFGSMSIVGPRPHALGSRAADKLFWEVDSRYWHRHAAKPGLTGLAQIRGYRGATLEEVDLQNRLQADLEYLNTWSIWRDLKIILLTFKVIVHRNAF